MHIQIHNSDPKPIYEQIVGQIRQKILDGTLKEGDALPSIRLLAKELRISVITTKRAYQELEGQGMIVTVPGKGCFVANPNMDFLREEKRRELEELLEQIGILARVCGVSKNELKTILDEIL